VGETVNFAGMMKLASDSPTEDKEAWDSAVGADRVDPKEAGARALIFFGCLAR
jgi:hypothetical protein